MDRTQLILALIGSAAIGALVSSAVSLLSQFFERRDRRQQLLLKEALALSEWRIKMNIRTNHSRGRTALIPDKVVFAETYYVWLKYLMKHSKLPADHRIQRKLPD